MVSTWFRCPRCGHASPDFDVEGSETVDWSLDQVPCDNCGSHEVLLCPHCHQDFDPFGSERLPVQAGAVPEPPLRPAPERPAHTWPPRSW